jgi:hypothetical protein
MPSPSSLYILGSEWSIVNGPAAGVQATATNGSSTNQRHVVSCIAFSFYGSAAGAAYVAVRDGASNVGTIIWSVIMSITAAGQSQNIAIPFPCGLRGSYGAALTVEFQNSVANVQQTISANGYMECLYPP